MPHLEQRVGPLAGGMAQQTAATHGPDHSRPLFDFRIWHLADIPAAPACVRYWTKADIGARRR